LTIKIFDILKLRARQLKTETYVLYLAYKDPRVPWYAKFFIACVVSYAFSPIDLVPDFVPIIGYLDDVILVAIGITLALKMIPPTVLADCRERARHPLGQKKPTNWIGAVVIICIWVLFALLVTFLIARVTKK
jgi:uncharacterized membrane protein YkvA (DUF1232 family)